MPLLLEHTVLQVPQWLVSAARDISQPSAVLLLQSPYRYVQAPITQLPEGHVGVAFAYEQRLPQELQLVVVPSWVSQPFELLVSQLA